MDVYAVWLCGSADNHYLHAIFTTREMAEQWGRKMVTEYQWFYPKYAIEKFTLDQPK